MTLQKNNLGAKRRSKDKLAEQLLQAADGIDDLHNDAVRLWKQTEFRHLGLHDRLKLTRNLIETAKNVLSQAERGITGLLPRAEFSAPLLLVFELVVILNL
jgi:hypothetical protein